VLATRVSGDASGFLVVSQSDFPGWRAHVNGIEQPVRRVYGFLQGVEVPSGTAEVVLEYAPNSFRAGAVLSLAAGSTNRRARHARALLSCFADAAGGRQSRATAEWTTVGYVCSNDERTVARLALSQTRAGATMIPAR
jgi:hypothetical protein